MNSSKCSLGLEMGEYYLTSPEHLHTPLGFLYCEPIPLKRILVLSSTQSVPIWVCHLFPARILTMYILHCVPLRHLRSRWQDKTICVRSMMKI